MAGGQDDAALGLALADDAGGGWGGEDAATSHQGLGHSVGRGHAQDGLNGLAVVEAPVAADHQGAALQAGLGVEDRLDEVLEIIRLLEDLDLLAQSGGAWTLSGERLGADDAGCHVEKPLISVEVAYILPRAATARGPRGILAPQGHRTLSFFFEPLRGSIYDS